MVLSGTPMEKAHGKGQEINGKVGMLLGLLANPPPIAAVPSREQLECEFWTRSHWIGKRRWGQVLLAWDGEGQ